MEQGSKTLASYSYDRMSRLTGISRANGLSTALSYTAIGNLQNFDHTGIHKSSFGHNPAGQLISRLTSTSDYQIKVAPSGTTAYLPNNLNQYTTHGGQSFSYDSNGNLTAFDGWTYSYNAHNRLTAASKSGQALSLQYDAIGRLNSSTLNGSKTVFLYDGNELIAEYNAAGTLLKRYAHGSGSDDPLVSYDGTGTANPTYLLADERGSIMAETNASGTVTAKHQYGPYGEPINQSASRFRYTGQILLPGTELYHYKARVYHPKLGRFLQTDPLGYKDGMNWYAYVGNDPMNKVDPDGLTGRFRDGDRLGALGSVIGEITGVISPEAAESIRAGQEGRLPDHLKKADSQSQTNRSRTSKTEKHHVVPHRDRRAAGARANMKANGINPKTESTNIVPISGDKHDITKRESYVNSTNDRIEAQNGPDEIRAECCKIANELTTKSTEELDKAYPRKK